MWFAHDRSGVPVLRTRTFSFVILVVAILTSLLSISPLAAQGQVQELLLPFSAGVLEIQADETYEGNRLHPSIGEIAFDFTDIERTPNSAILSMGHGRVRLACVDRHGSAVVQFQADGYAGDIYYAHLDQATIPARITNEWSRIQRGALVGRLYPYTLQSSDGDNCAQDSTGPHLHLDLPRSGMIIDGIRFDASGPNDTDHVVSTNRLPSERDTASCSDETATIVGTSGADVLQGTPGRDVIAGLEGNDVIFGLEGNDLICGGPGADRLVGGEGVDVIFGARGNDTIIAANGTAADERNDSVGGGKFFGGGGDDVIFGSNHADKINGGPGDDAVTGFDGSDVIRGGDGEDLLEGGGSVDNVGGGRGADVIVTGGGDVVHGGAARDVCQFDDRPASMTSCEVTGSL